MMEESFPFKPSAWEYAFTCLGLLFFLLDIAMDVWTVVSLYQEEAYVYMGLMIFILLGSSVLLQVFSWIWYSESLDALETEVENKVINHNLMKPFHILQLGIHLRYAGIIEVSTRDFLYQQNVVEESAYLSNDLQMLRLFEAFSESAPQLTLMMCLTLQRGELELFTGFKLFSSAASIASVMSMYHHSMRVFLDKNPCTGTAVFFLWNLMLIIARVSALALFCSVFSCYITVHFLLWWMVLIFVAWRQKTNFMDSRGWECLYRASVGLIWYFSWFNISAGRKGFKSAIYHSIMGLDTAMLLGFWCWKVIEFGGCWRSLNPSIVIPVVLGLYICGILLQIVYYKLFHPQGDPQKIEELTESRQKVLGNRLKKRMALFYRTDPLVPDSRDSPVLPITGALNRSRTIATNFFF
ncbi:hypothetical protein DNTS_023833 [Danionella cerebrum]|uniref:XK-related protein n=1 Tax=Danionella cerebrum TaxID=2873325 RepID=A0A553QTG2_9TELE|nr:hypothetical protein DNTS_023833 [Danionella translucida]